MSFMFQQLSCTALDLCSFNPILTQETIEKAFEIAWKYAETFEPFRQYYRDNENLDVDMVGKGEHGQ